MTKLEGTPSHHLAGYIVRGDFSRWIGDVFGDRALADELRILEQRYRSGVREDTVPAIANAVRGRYDLADEGLEVGERASLP